MAARDEQLVSVEERVKALNKAKSKGDSSLAEVEEKLEATEKERAMLVDKQRAADVELGSLRDTIHSLNKLVDDLKAELARKYAWFAWSLRLSAAGVKRICISFVWPFRTEELEQVQAQLEAEQNKSMAVGKENRDLTGQLNLLREELEAEQVGHLHLVIFMERGLIPFITDPQGALAKLRKDKAAVDTFVKELEDRVEDKSSATAAQADLRAKRETELASLKQKFEQASQIHEQAVQELKRKAQQQQVHIGLQT